MKCSIMLHLTQIFTVCLSTCLEVSPNTKSFHFQTLYNYLITHNFVTDSLDKTVHPQIRMSKSIKISEHICTLVSPEVSSTMWELSGAHCTDARLYTFWIKIGTRTSTCECSHCGTRLGCPIFRYILHWWTEKTHQSLYLHTYTQSHQSLPCSETWN